MGKTTKANKDNICDCCDRVSLILNKFKVSSGGIMMVCRECEDSSQILKTPLFLKTAPDNVKSSDKLCGCTHDGGNTSYCIEHDRHYCYSCTDGRGKCPDCEFTPGENRFENCKHSSAAATHCQYHSIWYCSICNSICPNCHAAAASVSLKDTFSSKINPLNYPLVLCNKHGWYCSRCDKNCPSCNKRKKNDDILECNSHKSHYCSRCGLGCRSCGKLMPSVVKTKKYVLQCPTCKQEELYYCEKHKSHYCASCDGKCLRCDGCYAKNDGNMYHKCGHAMSHCNAHKKYFCIPCGQKCKICASSRKHRCGKPMSVCKIHDRSFCPNCSSKCDDCNKEAEVAKNRLTHHCGNLMLFCAKHRRYFCLGCDYLCDCSVNCGIVEKYASKEDRNSHFNLLENIEGHWDEFQTWLKSKDVILNSFDKFYENWHEFLRFLYVNVVSGYNSGDYIFSKEVNDEMMIVDSGLKSLRELMSGLRAREEDLDDGLDINDTEIDEALDRAYGGKAYYKDSDGRIHYFQCEQVDFFTKVEIFDEGDDLLEGAKITNFQSIAIEKKVKT